jgi:ABC-2 type transport system permease protein
MTRFVWSRYWSVVKKEVVQIKRDRPSLMIALAMPLMLLFLFGYAVNTDVEDIKMVVWNQSPSADSRELVDQFANTRIFQVCAQADGYRAIEAMLDEGSADVALVIPPDFTRKRDREEPVEIQMLIDGSDPNIARTAMSNAQLIVQNSSLSLQELRMQKQGLGDLELPLELDSRVLFNPNMESIVFNIPGLIGLIMQNVTMILTAFSLVREKERGTMEQLIVTPIRPLELMLGKITPYVGVGIFSFCLVLMFGIYWFGVPVKGSIPLLVSLSVLFLVTTLTLGIFISTVARTQLQAMQMAFAFILPSVLLSGFMFPRETMPLVIQWMGGLIPLTYFLEILRGIFLKGVDLSALWRETIGMAAFCLLILIVAMMRFRKKIE